MKFQTGSQYPPRRRDVKMTPGPAPKRQFFIAQALALARARKEDPPREEVLLPEDPRMLPLNENEDTLMNDSECD